jgi:hypothetical protein
LPPPKAIVKAEVIDGVYLSEFVKSERNIIYSQLLASEMIKSIIKRGNDKGTKTAILNDKNTSWDKSNDNGVENL